MKLLMAMTLTNFLCLTWNFLAFAYVSVSHLFSLQLVDWPEEKKQSYYFWTILFRSWNQPVWLKTRNQILIGIQYIFGTYMVLTQRNKYLKQDFCSFDKNIEFLLREVWNAGHRHYKQVLPYCSFSIKW